MKAVEGDHVGIVERLIDRDVDIHTRNDLAFNIAVTQGLAEIVKLFVERIVYIIG